MIYLENGFIDLNEKSGNYFYKLCDIGELSMGLWASRVAFYNNQKELIYHKKDQKIIWLVYEPKFNVVYWNLTGDCALFYDYKRNEIAKLSILNCFENTIYSLQAVNLENLEMFVLNFKNIDSKSLHSIYNDFGFEKDMIYKDKVEDIPYGFFRKKKWLPK